MLSIKDGVVHHDLRRQRHAPLQLVNIHLNRVADPVIHLDNECGPHQVAQSAVLVPLEVLRLSTFGDIDQYLAKPVASSSKFECEDVAFPVVLMLPLLGPKRLQLFQVAFRRVRHPLLQPRAQHRSRITLVEAFRVEGLLCSVVSDHHPAISVGEVCPVWSKRSCRRQVQLPRLSPCGLWQDNGPVFCRFDIQLALTVIKGPFPGIRSRDLLSDGVSFEVVQGSLDIHHVPMRLNGIQPHVPPLRIG